MAQDQWFPQVSFPEAIVSDTANRGAVGGKGRLGAHEVCHFSEEIKDRARIGARLVIEEVYC